MATLEAERAALAARLTVFDIETDRLIDRGVDRDSAIDALEMTVCVVMTGGADGARHDFVMSGSAATGLTAEDVVTLAHLGSVLDASELLVAFNGRGFDLRVLGRYYARERVASWAARLVDPFELIRDLTGSWVKLDELLALNGLPGKQGDGVDAVTWWADGQRDRVLEYCADDVRALRALVVDHGLMRPRGTIRFPIKRWDRLARAQVIVEHRRLDWASVVVDAAAAAGKRGTAA